MSRHVCKILICFLILECGCFGRSYEWAAVNLDNGLISLQVVPEIGGRVLQYQLCDYGFFWVNSELYNQKPPASGVGPDGEWLNYGGDKLWLAPQGWDNDRQWPGPPDPVLDGQPHELEIISPKEIRLTSRKDPRSGVQLSRVIRIFDGTTRVSIDAFMKNIDTKPRRWGIWDHAQFNAGSRHGEGYNQNFWAYCPLNKKSIFPKGYDVQYGLVNNTSYMPDYDKGIMKVHYQRRVGKIGIDCSAGWAATVDATDGYVFVHRFQYEPEKPYPDNSSVEIWMNGLGEFVAWGKINRMSEDPKVNPYIFESELISPYADLKPGQEFSFHYEWYSARIFEGMEVIDCSDVGVICRSLTAVKKGSELQIAGSFGVFYEGQIKISLLDQDGKAAEETFPGISVSPLEKLKLNLHISPVDLPSVKAVSISVCDKNKNNIGELAKAPVSSD